MFLSCDHNADFILLRKKAIVLLFLASTMKKLESLIGGFYQQECYYKAVDNSLTKSLYLESTFS